MAQRPLTQSELISRIQADMEYDVSKPVVKNMLAALEAVCVDAMEGAEKVKVGNLVTFGIRIRPKTKKRMGRNPATGEEIEISAKPAAAKVYARLGKPMRDAAPNVQKARRRLAA